MLKKDEKFANFKSSKFMNFVGSDLFFNMLLGFFALMILATGTFLTYLYGKNTWWKEDHPISRKTSPDIVIKFNPSVAPKTVSNFMSKIESGYFDGLKFHRAEDWVVQGGDPLSRDNDPTNDGTGGGDIPTEISEEKFVRGSVGVARGPNKAISNDSQFFIVKNDTSDFLNGEYTYFGQVIAGMDLVDNIKVGDVIKKIEKIDDKTVRIYLLKDGETLTKETA